MKALRVRQPGIEGLNYEDMPDPKPAIGDVLVKVRACGITPTELDWPLWTDRNGHKRDYIIPAHEFSGVVAAVGFGAPAVAVGDEVYGLIDGLRDGAGAEYIVIEARCVAPKPKTLDYVQAAAVPQAGLTSWQALFDHGRLQAGQTVLILGSAGALGLVAAQLARSIGARVVGAGRSNARSASLEAGADEFVDLEQAGWEKAAGKVDVVYDTIGGDILEQAIEVVRPGGTLVTVMSPPNTKRGDIRIVHFIRDPNGKQLAELARMIDSGKLRSQVGAVYPLSDGRTAFTDQLKGSAKGKVILEVSTEPAARAPRP